MQICPSILENEAKNYFLTVEKLKPYFNYFQLDFTDGKFVKNQTASLDKFIEELRNYKNITENLSFDFHLMVNDIKTYIEKINTLTSQITIKNILVHFQPFSNLKLKISNLSSYPIGLSLNPQDQVDNLVGYYNLDKLMAVQIMSVHPGVQGNPFLPETLNKIEQLRKHGYRNKIFLDGAVNDKTLPIILSKKYQPDVICPGSYLSKAGDDLEKRVIILKNTLSS